MYHIIIETVFISFLGTIFYGVIFKNILLFV